MALSKCTDKTDGKREENNMSKALLLKIKEKLNVLRKPYIQHRISVSSEINRDDGRTPTVIKTVVGEYKIKIFDLLMACAFAVTLMSLVSDIARFFKRLFR